MTQPKLFPEWRETVTTAEIEAQALKLAKTPTESNTGQIRPIRPTIDNSEKSS